MKQNLRNTLFGFRTERAAESFAKFKAAKPGPTFNEEGTTLAKVRTRRVLSVTEQRLRAHHQRSWLTDMAAWRRLFARLVRAA